MVRGVDRTSLDDISGSEAGSYVRLIDFAYHSTLGLKGIKKKKRTCLDDVFSLSDSEILHPTPVLQSDL